VLEHFHGQRAQIEERFKDAKLGHGLRHPLALRRWTLVGPLQPHEHGLSASRWHFAGARGSIARLARATLSREGSGGRRRGGYAR